MNCLLKASTPLTVYKLIQKKSDIHIRTQKLPVLIIHSIKDILSRFSNDEYG